MENATPQPETSSRNSFPLLPLIIALTPIIALMLLLTASARVTVIFVSSWSGILFVWVMTMIGRRIWFAARGQKEPLMKKWQQQVTTGGTWYFITFVLCLMIFLALWGLSRR